MPNISIFMSKRLVEQWYRPISENTIVVSIGRLTDWWYGNVYWTHRITQDDHVMDRPNLILLGSKMGGDMCCEIHKHSRIFFIQFFLLAFPTNWAISSLNMPMVWYLSRMIHCWSHLKPHYQAGHTYLQNEYEHLAGKLSNYVVQLIDHVRSTAELDAILNATHGSHDDEGCDGKLARLKLALRYEEKKVS